LDRRKSRRSHATRCASSRRPRSARSRRCDEDSQTPDAFLEQAWQLGLVATQIPEAYGGAGEARSPITNVLVLEELAHGDAGLALAAVSPALFAMPVVEFGTEAQKRELLPLFCGERFHAASLALVEPGPCFDPTALRTRAERKGDGFVLSGVKCCVPLADRASHFLVLARENGGDAVQAYVVPRDAAGLAIATPEKNLGLRALTTGTLTLERVEVPASARLGGDAGCDARRIVNLARTAQAAVLVGVSRAVMEYAIPYAKDREAFDEAIAKKQAIAFTLADMCIEVDAMRWLVWQAASRLENGLDATREAQLARTYCAKQAMKIADDGVQVLGGHGFIREHPVELWYRNARTLGVLDGAGLV
jgi:alkylation response protein AidB-like acyl-CoA dehydrogenase